MSALVSRIVLAILMLPTAGLSYIVIFVAAQHTSRTWDSPFAFIVGGITAWAVAAVYWFMLWGRTVRWTSRRQIWTGLIAAGAIVAAIIIAVFVDAAERIFGDFVGSVAAPLIWLIAVTWLWRETLVERSERIRSAQKATVVCPACGYNLTGLQSTRCPECGKLYTIDELFAGQPLRAELGKTD